MNNALEASSQPVGVTADAPGWQTALQHWWVWVLFFFSGACGLIYEVLWCRQLGLIFGNTVHSMSAVLTAFMGGLALGSFAAGRVCHRLKRPLLVYGLFEVCIGLYCALLPWLFSNTGPLVPLYRSYYGEVGGESLVVVRFAVSLALLLVPTILMGATLPVLSQFLVRSSAGLGRTAGTLYAVNTFGAVSGAAATGFILLPLLGKLNTNWLAVASNLVLGVLAIVLGRRAGSQPQAEARPAADAKLLGESPAEARAIRLAVIVFGITGFAAMATQIAWVRAITLSTGSSTYAFSLIVALFILGLALGGTWGSRLAPRLKDAVASLGHVLLLTAFLCTLVISVLSVGPLIFYYLLRWSTQFSWPFVLTCQALAIGVLLMGPTFLMGATMPLTLQIASRAGQSAGRTVGTIYAVNTLGSILGSFLGGMLLLPSLALQTSLTVLALCYGGCGLVMFMVSASRREAKPLRLALLAAAATLLLVVFSPAWDPNVITCGSYLLRNKQQPMAGNTHTIYYREGAAASVAIITDGSNISLLVGGKPDASNVGDLSTQVGLTLVPALLHARGAEEVLVIGLGSGISVGAVRDIDTVKRVDVVEMSPEVVEASVFFKEANHLNYTAPNPPAWIDTPRVEVLINDGRNHLLLTQRRYDVISSEPSNPWMAGVGNLFTRESFQLCRERLKPGGLMCQWVHRYSLAERDFLCIVRTFCEIFPHAQLWTTLRNDFLLIGSDQPIRVPLQRLEQRLKSPALQPWLQATCMESAPQFLRRFIAEKALLERGSRDVPLHTDDNMLLEFSAPRALYFSGQLFASTRFDVLLDPILDFAGMTSAERSTLLRQLDLLVAASENVRLGYEGLGPHDAHMERAFAIAPHEEYSRKHWRDRLQSRTRALASGQPHPSAPDPAAAVRELERAVQQQSATELQSALVAAYVALAEQLHEQGRAAEALATLDKIDDRAQPIPALLLRAKLLAAQGAEDEVLQILNVASNAGASPITCAQIVARMFLQRNKLDAALHTIEGIVQNAEAYQDPRTLPIWQLRAEVCRRMQLGAEATRSVAVAAALGPADEETLRLRAALACEEGKFEEGLWFLRRRTHVKPADNQIVRELLNAMLESVEKHTPKPRAGLSTGLLTRRLAHVLCQLEPVASPNLELLQRAQLCLASYDPANAEFHRSEAQRVQEQLGRLRE